MLPTSITGPAREAAEQLTARGETVAVAESSAGGLVSAALLSIPGASAYYRGGAVVYTLDGARTILTGGTDLGPGDRGATETFARFLAAGAAGKLGADWGVSETGAAGPTGNRYGDPAGHAWVCVAGPGGALRAAHVLTGEGCREANMEAFAAGALRLLAAALDARRDP